MNLEALRYSILSANDTINNPSALASLGTTVTNPVTPAAEYLGKDLDAAVGAMMLALNVTSIQGVYVPFHEDVSSRSLRLDLSLGVVGGDGHTMDEDLYLVRFRDLDGNGAVVLEKAADLTWTCGGTAIGTGARSSHKWVKGVTVGDTGLLAARGLKAMSAPPAGTPAIVTLWDIGPYRGVLRMLSKGASATSVQSLHQKWK